MLTEIDIGILMMIAETKSIDEIWSIQSVQKLFFDRQSLEHIFTGYFTERQFVGYHSEYLYPNKYNQDINIKNKNSNKNQPYILYLDVNQTNLKFSSFFPITMTPVDIVLATDDAYKDWMKNQKIKNTKEIGYSAKYRMNIVICRNKTTNKLYDSYPLI